MGVEQLGRVIENRYKPCKENKIPSKVSSLFIDCNGIFYGAKDEVYLTKRNRAGDYIYSEEKRKKLQSYDKTRLEEKHIKKILEKLEEIIKKFNPTTNLILAPDGVANAAKMSQQKTRRYGNLKKEEDIFNTHSLTPGTPFMVNLDKAIKKWLKNNSILPENTIYSSHLVEGEGEHKIFDIVREDRIIKDNGVTIIYGADGDLFILSILAPLENIYLFRDNNNTFFNIDVLRKLILKDLMSDINDDKIIFQDFALLSFFLANDFLPKFPSLPRNEETLGMVFEMYRQLKKPLTDNQSNILWKNMLEFFNIFNNFKLNDFTLYENITRNNYTYPHKEIRDSTVVTDSKGNVLENTNFDISKHIIKFNETKFSSSWYTKVFKPKNNILITFYDDKPLFSKRDVMKMCHNYLSMLQWNIKYYTIGPLLVSNTFFYHYKYTPLTDAVENYLKYIIDINSSHLLERINNENNINLTAVHQLMLVLPPSSIDLIPPEFRELYKIKLASISPTEFPAPVAEGSDNDYMAKVKIPNINIYLIKKILKDCEIPEYLRNTEDIVVKGKRKETINFKPKFSFNNKILM